MDNFIAFRNNFMKHVRRQVKNLRYDERVPYIESNFIEILKSFEQTKYMRNSSIPFLRKLVLKKFKDLQKRTEIFIIESQMQIDLTNRQKHVNNKDREYIRQREKRIKYLSEKYSPKVPEDKNGLFTEDVFDEGNNRLKFFVRDNHNVIEPEKYKIEKLYGSFYVTPIVQKSEEPEIVDIIHEVKSRYYKS